MSFGNDLGQLLGSPDPCLIHEGQCTCPPLKISGGISIQRSKVDQMQSSHPRYITSGTDVVDPDTGTVLYAAETPIPWAEAVKHGLVATRQAKAPPNTTSRKPQANRARKPQANREA